MTDSLSFDLYHPQSLLVVISGPSGVGKDVTLQMMKQRNFPLHFVVTATSRPPRLGEQDGVDYFFVSPQRFEEMISNNELIEYATVYGQYKGIPRFQVRQAFNSGRDVILRIDVQGAASIRKLYPDAVLIFLLPGNEEEWLCHLRERKTETPKSLAVRVATAREELKRLGEFDYVVVNTHGSLDKTVDTIAAIITAEHHRVSHRKVEL
jgi:guanylate kinase